MLRSDWGAGQESSRHYWQAAKFLAMHTDDCQSLLYYCRLSAEVDKTVLPSYGFAQTMAIHSCLWRCWDISSAGVLGKTMVRQGCGPTTISFWSANCTVVMLISTSKRTHIFPLIWQSGCFTITTWEEIMWKAHSVVVLVHKKPIQFIITFTREHGSNDQSSEGCLSAFAEIFVIISCVEKIE